MFSPPIARRTAGKCLHLSANASFFPLLYIGSNALTSARNYAEISYEKSTKAEAIKRRQWTKKPAFYPAPRLSEHEPMTVGLRAERNALQIKYAKFAANDGYVTIPARWLRDNCACKQCRHQDTAQRQINVLKGNVDCNISRVEVLDHGMEVVITFGDGHQTRYTKEQLLGRRSPATSHKRQGVIPITTWDATIASRPPTVLFETLKSEGLGPLLKNIRVFGFCFVDGMPPTPEASEALLAAIGPIRNTHYGGFYDFTADLSSKDTAYTSESLEPHTDNTYFTEPTGLQALHLLSHTEGSGGESSLVDGFSVAAQLFEQNPPAYFQLSSVGVYGHASGNEGISIQSAHAVPTLSHDPVRGYLTQVRWNNADRAGIDCSVGAIDRWYDAATEFDALLSDPKNQYWFQLTPGKMLIFDNWRVLHGRAAFTGKRRMCGGYINRDDFISRYRMTNMSDKDIRASTVTG